MPSIGETVLEFKFSGFMQAQVDGELKRALASQQLRARELEALLEVEKQLRVNYEKDATAKLAQADVLIKAKRRQTEEAEAVHAKMVEEISRLKNENDSLAQSNAALTVNVADLQAVNAELKHLGVERRNFQVLIDKEKKHSDALADQLALFQRGHQRPTTALKHLSITSAPAVTIVSRQSNLEIQTFSTSYELIDHSSSDSSLEDFLRASGLSLGSRRPRRPKVDWQLQARNFQVELESLKRRMATTGGIERGSQTARSYLEVCAGNCNLEIYSPLKRSFGVQAMTEQDRSNKPITSATQTMFVNLEISTFKNSRFGSMDISELRNMHAQTDSAIFRSFGTLTDRTFASSPATTQTGSQSSRVIHSQTSPKNLEISSVSSWEADYVEEFKSRCEAQVRDVHEQAAAVSAFSEKLANRYQNLEISYQQKCHDLEEANARNFRNEKTIEELIDRTATYELHFEKKKFPGPTVSCQTSVTPVKSISSQTLVVTIPNPVTSYAQTVESPKRRNFQVSATQTFAPKRTLLLQNSKIELPATPRISVPKDSHTSPPKPRQKNSTAAQTDEVSELEKVKAEAAEALAALAATRANTIVRIKGLESAHRADIARMQKQHTLEISKFSGKSAEELKLEKTKLERALQLRTAKLSFPDYPEFLDTCEKWIEKNGPPPEAPDAPSTRLRTLLARAIAEGYCRAGSRLRRNFQVLKLFSRWRLSPASELPPAKAVVAAQAADHEAWLRAELRH